MAEGFIVAGLDGERGVVRSCVEEGGFSKVKEDCLLAVSISMEIMPQLAPMNWRLMGSYCCSSAKSLPSFGHAAVIAKGSPPGRHLG